jgi:AcrR family transcriptional regulator
VDGRSQRSVRSRQQIVTALIGLVREGELLPTADQVASRAGVGLRTVFRHFQDMESLYAEMHERMREHMRSSIVELFDETAIQGSLEERVREGVRLRATLFESIAPFKRSEVVQRWNSSFLKGKNEEMVRELRAGLKRTLPETDACSAPIARAVELLTSFEAWDRLRTDQGLGPEQAREVIETALLELLGG